MDLTQVEKLYKQVKRDCIFTEARLEDTSRKLNKASLELETSKAAHQELLDSRDRDALHFRQRITTQEQTSEG